MVAERAGGQVPHGWLCLWLSARTRCLEREGSKPGCLLAGPDLLCSLLVCLRASQEAGAPSEGLLQAAAGMSGGLCSPTGCV